MRPGFSPPELVLTQPPGLSTQSGSSYLPLSSYVSFGPASAPDCKAAIDVNSFMVEPIVYPPEMARLVSGLRAESCCGNNAEYLACGRSPMNHRLSNVGYDAMPRISPLFGSSITIAPAGAWNVCPVACAFRSALVWLTR